MRPYKILIFIFVCIGMLAGVCVAMPEGGIPLGEDTALRFPTLTDMLSADTTQEAQLTPEQLLALHEQEMKMQEANQYETFFRENPVRIHFPAGDCTYFDTLYAELDRAHDKKVRIVHYGDSQLEEDRISCVLRQQLQEQFGGMGVGMLALRSTLYSQTVNQRIDKQLTKYLLYGPASGRRDSSNCYGPMAGVTLLDSTSVWSVSPFQRNKGLRAAHYFSQMTVLTKSNSPIHVHAQGATTTIQPNGERLQMTRILLKDSTSSMSATFSGYGDVYGILLDGKTGVNVDNIALRGCSGTMFTGIDAAQLRTYFRQTNTRLIILQFGGNSMPYLKNDKGIDNYVGNLRRQIQYLKRQAPDAVFLFIGPSDMTTKVDGHYQTYPLLSKVDKAICQMVNDEGCAYWSLFESMGGKGSMMRWANANPALAGKDYVHFTRLGAQRAGELLTQSIMTGYQYYQFREREKQLQNVEPLEPTVMELKPETLKR